MKEQINLYENAVKYGVTGLDQSEDWENQMSDSCMDLGLKKSSKKNGLYRYLINYDYLQRKLNLHVQIYINEPCMEQHGHGPSF